MLKKLSTSVLFVSMFALVSFHLPSDKTIVVKQSAPIKKLTPITLEVLTTFNPGSTAARVQIDFETSTNTILGARIYYTSGPFECLEYCVVTSITGGPINFAGGKWRAVNSITVSCDWGSTIIPAGAILSDIPTIC